MVKTQVARLKTRVLIAVNTGKAEPINSCREFLLLEAWLKKEMALISEMVHSD